MTKKYTLILAGQLFFGVITSFGMKNSAPPVDNGRALIKAAGREGHLEQIQQLLATTNPNYATESGVTALHEVTASTDDIGKLMLLVKAGAKVNAQTKGSLKTALHYAAQLDRTGAVIMLIEAGADTKLIDKRGMTPFKWAKSDFEQTRKAFISTISPQDLLPKLSQILALKNGGAYSKDAGEIIATTILPELIEARLALIPEYCYLKSDYPKTDNPEESLKETLRDAMIASINRVIREAPCLQDDTTLK